MDAVLIPCGNRVDTVLMPCGNRVDAVWTPCGNRVDTCGCVWTPCGNRWMPCGIVHADEMHADETRQDSAAKAQHRARFLGKTHELSLSTILAANLSVVTPTNHFFDAKSKGAVSFGAVSFNSLSSCCASDPLWAV